MTSLQSSGDGKAMLHVENISVNYGTIEAIRDISFTVEQGEILTIIGANGAGKTTTLKTIAGLLKPAKGRIRLREKIISNMKAHEIVREKLSLAPEGRGIFLNLTVEENLDLGAYAISDRKNLPSLAEDMERVYSLFPRLKERRHQNSGTMSGGEQQMLAIGRALMAHPEILLLDEPSLGLAPQIIEKIFEIIQSINKAGTTVLLVEQNALQALEIAHRGLVIETGSIKLRGTAKELASSDEVRKAYLGD